MLKVLLFTNTIAPYRLPVFQRLSQTVDLYVLFAQGRTSDRQWDVELNRYTFRHRILPHRELNLGNAVQIINPDLLNHLWHSDFDVVILGDNRQTALSGLLISLVALVRNRPLITWTGITPGEARIARSSHSLQRLLSLYRQGVFRRAAAVIAYGTATSRYLIKLGIPAEKIFSGTQVVPPEQLPPPSFDRAALGLASKRVVLSVNYLLPRKGLDLLIEAFRRVAEPADALALVGSGPEGERLKRLANGDERILFPGYQAGSRKTSWYAAADLFAFPTLHDPWGLVVNEAMAFGLPIIATDAAGCVPDLVHHDDNGLVVPAGDVGALADALARLLADEKMRRRMGERSRAIIAHYTVERACNTFLKAIEYATS